MTIICSAVNTPFTPTAQTFTVQTVGEAKLMRKNAGGNGQFVLVDVIRGRALECSNPVASTVYQFEEVSDGVVVEAAE